MMVFLKTFFKEVEFEKNQQMTKSMQKYQVGKVFAVFKIIPYYYDTFLFQNALFHKNCTAVDKKYPTNSTACDWAPFGK